MGTFNFVYCRLISSAMSSFIFVDFSPPNRFHWSILLCLQFMCLSQRLVLACACCLCVHPKIIMGGLMIVYMTNLCLIRQPTYKNDVFVSSIVDLCAIV